MRLTFLSHFVCCLAIAAAAFFAFLEGVPQAVYAGDLSHMTSVIALVFVGSVGWLGWQAWQADTFAGAPKIIRGAFVKAPDTSFGHLAQLILPALGLFGTAFGLSLQAEALSGGAAAFGPLATSLYCTAAGVLAFVIIAILTFNLESGIRRAAQ